MSDDNDMNLPVNKMWLELDRRTNIGYVFLDTSEIHVVRTVPVDPRVNLDYDVETGRLVGIEIFGSEQ
jgi:uncharacterized protein YuzE